MTQKIWVSYHKDEQIEQYGLKEDATHILFPTHKKAEKRNINHLNPVYSEMVTMWYVWKNNLRSDYVGFEHYRRHFEVKRLPKKGECQVRRIVDFAGETVYHQYSRAHNAKDMDVILSLLDEQYGKGNPYSRHINEDTWLVANCCFFMKWADFVKLCKFMFPLLDAFSEKCGISNTNVEEWRQKAIKDFNGDRTEYQTRILSFLAERLISAWIVANLTPYVEGQNVAIVHYNTPELTWAAIRSLNKTTPGCRVYLFDNSDERPFNQRVANVEIIDNTKGEVINFDEELAKYADKRDEDLTQSNYGSAKHTMSVEKMFELIPDGFILMDSDVLVKRNLTPLFNRGVACGGAKGEKMNVPLLYPFLCWLNVPKLTEAGIHYFNGEKMWSLSNDVPNRYYDTGAWLLEEVQKKYLEVQSWDIYNFITHLGHGSWRGGEEKIAEWLEQNSQFWK